MQINFFVEFFSVILLQSGYSVSEITKIFSAKRWFSPKIKMLLICPKIKMLLFLIMIPNEKWSQIELDMTFYVKAKNGVP